MLNLPAHVQTAAAVSVNRLCSTDYLERLCGSRLCSAAGIGAARPTRHGSPSGNARKGGKQENGQRQTHCLEPWASTVLHFLLLLLLLAPVFYFVFVTCALLCLALLCATFWIDHAAWRTASLAFLRASALLSELCHELRKISRLRPLKGATRKNIVSS